jgi:predicted nucleic acid-binding protein
MSAGTARSPSRHRIAVRLDPRVDARDRRDRGGAAVVVSRDPADRLIYATAVEHGCLLVTKDRRLRSHRHPRPVTVW